MDNLILSAGKHCRGCLQPCDYQMYSLASKDPIGSNNWPEAESVVNLAEIYNSCTQMLYEYTSPNWEFICEICFRKLTEFFVFRQMCIESYNKIKEIELINSRQTESDELCFKVEVVDVGHILEPEPELILNHDDNFEHEANTSNWDEKMDIDLEETVGKNDKTDEETKHGTRSSRDRTHKKECNEPNNDKTSKFLDVESRDYDDDDYDYDARDDEDDNSDDDDDGEEYDSNAEAQIDSPSKSSNKSKKTSSTKKPNPSKWDYVCDICSRKFFKKHRYDAHMRTHLGLKKWKCEHCDRAFDKYTSLKLHSTAKHNDGEKPVFKCEVDGCDKSYAMKQTLRVHIRKVHEGIKPTYIRRICELCGKSFHSNALLVRHSYTHTKDSPFKCDICSKMFKSAYELRDHTLRHKGIRNFVCPTCGQTKTTKHDLREHMKYHNEDLQFPCNLCSMVFTRQPNMKRHMRVVHLGVKAYPCPHCDQSFGKAETLKNHVMTHTGERPHACTICDKKFIQSVALRTHMKTHNKVK